YNSYLKNIVVCPLLRNAGIPKSSNVSDVSIKNQPICRGGFLVLPSNTNYRSPVMALSESFDLYLVVACSPHSLGILFDNCTVAVVENIKMECNGTILSDEISHRVIELHSIHGGIIQPCLLEQLQTSNAGFNFLSDPLLV